MHRVHSKYLVNFILITIIAQVVKCTTTETPKKCSNNRIKDIYINSVAKNWNFTAIHLSQNDTSQEESNCVLEGVRNISEKSHGLILTVFNQESLAFKFQKVFPLQKFWCHWKNLKWYIKNISCGRVVVLGLLGNASVGLRHSTSYLTSLGSILVNQLLPETNWVWAFIKCGKTLYESSSIIYQSSFNVNLPMIVTPKLPEPLDEYDKFRKQFCDNNEILGDFCQDFNSSTFPYHPTLNVTFENLNNVPIIICAGSRLPYFFYTLKTLLKTNGIQPENIEVIIGGHKQEFIDLLKLMKIKFKVVELHGKQNAMLFQYYRQVYEHVYKNYNETSPAAIIVDEDVEVSPDFLFYMNQTIILLEQDPSLYCINSYSVTRGKMLNGDPSKVQRSISQVSWGYAVSLKFIEEALNIWTKNPSIHALYDHWLRVNVSNERHCVFPEKTRSLHFGIDGLNYDTDQEKEIYMLELPIEQEFGIQLKNSHLMIDSDYKQYLTNEIKNSKILTGNPCSKKFLHNIKNGSYSFYYLMVNFSSEGFAANYQLTGNCLGMWAYSNQGIYKGVLVLTLTPNLVLYAIAEPFSDYSYLRPPDVRVWDFNILNDTERGKVIDFRDSYAVKEYEAAFRGEEDKIRSIFFNLFSKFNATEI